MEVEALAAGEFGLLEEVATSLCCLQQEAKFE